MVYIHEPLVFAADVISCCYPDVQVKVARSRDHDFVLDFPSAFQHVCIHPGARAAIRKICKTMQLTERAAQPSHATLHRFGNTSGASTNYILALLESWIGIKKGDRVRSDIGCYT